MLRNYLSVRAHMGCPRLSAVRRRTHTIGVRLSASEWQTIAALAQGRGLRPTAG